MKDTAGSYRDAISTVDSESGKRKWVYPKKPKGRYYNARTILSYFLLAFLFGMPFVKFNGQPLLLFNVVERKFIIFGLTFMPQDFHLFVFAMIGSVVFITLFTVVFGRLFCGWVCPQTIFMEMVFRKVEYWLEGDANQQRKLNNGPWTPEKIRKKTIKHLIFFTFAVLIANTFLSYIIGADAVMKIVTEPIALHWKGFVAMLAFSGAFYFVFAYMREQVCVAVCPYGRLQGVLLDQNSVAIIYDFVRGEPRGKMKKGRKAAAAANPLSSIQDSVAQAADHAQAVVEDPGFRISDEPAAIANKLGDCVDCGLCVHVCPTGIDIRNGTQLECVNCTACIDACDEVMDKIGRPRGLIRYDSYNGVTKGERRIFTPRSLAYSAALLLIVAFTGYLFSGRNDVEALMLRTPGMLFQKVDEQHISNLYNYQVVNKTNREIALRFAVDNMPEAEIKMVGTGAPSVAPEGLAKGSLFIIVPTEALKDRKTKLSIKVYDAEGKLIDDTSTTFLGPIK